MRQDFAIMKELEKLYKNPLPASRSGVLYNAFAYPTKISPEAIAIYIACHTKIGDTVLDPFAGSGTTGLATLLCDQPTEEMLNTAKALGVKPVWGKRNAVLYELSTLGAFISQVMCNPPDSKKFKKVAKEFISEAEKELAEIYSVKDGNDNNGILRYAVWSEVLLCPKCKHESTFWDRAVKRSPLEITPQFICPKCKHKDATAKIDRAKETVFDKVLGKKHTRKKRVPVWLYGKTGSKTWNRKVTEADIKNLTSIAKKFPSGYVPAHEMQWGVLYRKGYHSGISHLHHFYTERNLIVFSRLWEKVELYPKELRNALKMLLLSYNSSHSTLMSRVVVKKGNTDFVITGSQSGVLYISNLPVEKNILEGIRRKVTTLAASFALVENSKSEVKVYNQSSTSISLKKKSVDYVFTDPPFGDYIPYSEINQINEAWLGVTTDTQQEVVVNSAQNKGVVDYTDLMKQVFGEIGKVLKDDGKLSLVFHSAKAEIWQALVSAFRNNGFKVSLSSILDKVQGSFKQVTSSIKVQGDPLLLLTKSDGKKNGVVINGHSKEHKIIRNIVENAFIHSNNINERKPERLFSRYVNACLESGIPVSKDAKQFYELLSGEILNTQHN